MTTSTRKTNLEATLTRLCGFAVEITVRGDKSFTLSAEGDRNFDKALSFLKLSGQVGTATQEYDAECDQTCCYFDVK